MKQVTAVINTYNEEKKLGKCLKSLRWVDEIIVVDMHSTDNTLRIARKFRTKIYMFPFVGYVEPARNFGISKAKNSWVLIVDSDEVIPKSLADKLIAVVNRDKFDYVSIPRKNIIFRKWIKHTGWWPDHKVRFFKKGYVKWKNEIHVPPLCKGKELKLKAKLKLSIIHYNYSSLDQFIGRLNRYTDKHADRLLKESYEFNYQDLIKKPANEFFSRYIRSRGYKDGLHGFILSILMSFYFFVTYTKVWERYQNK